MNASFGWFGCYLLHKLIYHFGVGLNLFDIGTIWIDTTIWNKIGCLKDGEYSDESTPVFRIKVLHLFRSKVRQPDRPVSPLSKRGVFQT
jgi:hypothetical protein